MKNTSNGYWYGIQELANIDATCGQETHVHAFATLGEVNV